MSRTPLCIPYPSPAASDRPERFFTPFRAAISWA